MQDPTSPKLLSAQEVAQEVNDKLRPLDAGWEVSGRELRKSFKFHDFREAMKFVNLVADLAEKACHHPGILISYDKVTLLLSTHSAGGLTGLDFQLARDVDFI